MKNIFHVVMIRLHNTKKGITELGNLSIETSQTEM